MNCLSKIKTKNFILASVDSAEHCEAPYSVSKRAAEDCVIEYCMMHNPKHFSIMRITDKATDKEIVEAFALVIEAPSNSILKV